MPTTHDYANLGRTTWRCQVWQATEYDTYNRLIATREITGQRSKGLARGFVTRHLRDLNLADPAGDYWGRIERGTYEDGSFDDAEYGWVHNADWEVDVTGSGQPIEEIGNLDTDGYTVQWYS